MTSTPARRAAFRKLHDAGRFAMPDLRASGTDSLPAGLGGPQS
jgi:hypothetical protein